MNDNKVLGKGEKFGRARGMVWGMTNAGVHGGRNWKNGKGRKEHDELGGGGAKIWCLTFICATYIYHRPEPPPPYDAT